MLIDKPPEPMRRLPAAYGHSARKQASAGTRRLVTDRIVSPTPLSRHEPDSTRASSRKVDVAVSCAAEYNSFDYLGTW